MTIFDIIDLKTGQIALAEVFARHEIWASTLIPMDLEGFAITQHGDLILLDECGNYVFCPPDRFKVIMKFQFDPIAKPHDDR